MNTLIIFGILLCIVLVIVSVIIMIASWKRDRRTERQMQAITDAYYGWDDND